ncbi:conserved hypothetical protein [Kyrpidia tusciae DSM 2912]|uniref:Rhodanese domain-containing protein n=1 Tax=Kyrpidia tusciae (strain DSM 2912 / NBRC 15312 / T2) TaxID=562970 RepID=D5WT19_KYRT2|nr:conserved hypothetical protein [Kyrpidia tusciae DSM 2912]
MPGEVNLDPAAYTASDLPGDKNVTLVFYCKDPGCGAARHAARRAERMGYPHVFVMPDGIEGWVRAGNAVEQG